MVLKRKTPYNKKVARKTYKKKVYAKKSLVKLIKKVSLKQNETKNSHLISENNQLYHNAIQVTNSLLALNQGIGDTQTGSSWNNLRIGDEIIARGK